MREKVIIKGMREKNKWEERVRYERENNCGGDERVGRVRGKI